MKEYGEYVGWHFWWIEEWSQFFQPYNWRTFHPVHVELEDERNMGGVEASFIFMGVGFRVRYNYRETEILHDLRREVEEINRQLTQ